MSKPLSLCPIFHCSAHETSALQYIIVFDCLVYQSVYYIPYFLYHKHLTISHIYVSRIQNPFKKTLDSNILTHNPGNLILISFSFLFFHKSFDLVSPKRFISHALLSTMIVKIHKLITNKSIKPQTLQQLHYKQILHSLC